MESGSKRGDWRSSLKYQREGNCQQLCLGSQPHDPCRTEKHERTHKIQGSEDVEEPRFSVHPLLSSLIGNNSAPSQQPCHSRKISSDSGLSYEPQTKVFPFCVKMGHFRSLLLRDKITVVISKVVLAKLLVETIRLLQVTRNLTTHV